MLDAWALHLQSTKVTHRESFKCTCQKHGRCTCSPQKSLTENNLSVLVRSVDSSLSQCDHFILMGDFSSKAHETFKSSFMELLAQLRECVQCDRTALEKKTARFKEKWKSRQIMYRYEWHVSLGSIFQNLLVDFPWMISFNQQCHIRTNVN